MNRRAFLKSLLAIGGSACIPSAVMAASDEVIEEAWQCVTESPVVFYVREYGTLTTDPTYDSFPSSRRALYELDALPSDREALLSYIFDNPSVCERAEYLHECAETELSLDDWIEDDDNLDEVRWAIDMWLDGNPDEYDWESASWSGNSGQGYALSYFRDDFEYCSEFDIAIIEGECPGSSYFAAELRMSINEANQLAEQMGVPIRFAWLGF